MALSIETYALSRKYTNETAAQFGGLKGASCKVKSIEKQDGQNIVTFEWKNDDGETRQSVMYVDDGTPIYVWESGHRYKFGDLVIYASCFYRCIQENSDIVFDDKKWNEIGNPDGQYDIVQNSSMLPPRFTSADRKLYYCIDEELFYLWDGTNWNRQDKLIQFEFMPNPLAIYSNVIVQYIGQTNTKYTIGYFYRCELDENSQYHWVNINTQYSSKVAKTGDYNDLINKPATYLIGDNNNPIILSDLDSGLYIVIGSYCFYAGGDIEVATDKKYFIVEPSLENCYITEINGKRLKRYSYSVNDGLTEINYMLETDVEDILNNEFDNRADSYVAENVATAQDIADLFPQN
ncbi:MAG TPA: hypothetical protein P5513_03390 [Candidatus Diapherotrites archaeon]|nr:hypothetical protein [Candidatus Diapherotrites archaeon]